VKTHLKRIREKAAPFVGDPSARTLAAWLRDRPAEFALEGG
jgi:hypothetical protein